MRHGKTIIFFFIFLNKIFSQNNSWQNILGKAQITDPQKCIIEVGKIKNSLERRNETKDSVYAKVLHILARSYQQLNNYPKAIYYYKNSIIINSDYNLKSNVSHLALSYYNLGAVYNDIQDFSKSLFCYDKCLFIWGKYNIKTNLKGMVYYMKSKILFSTADFSNSLQYSSKSISDLDEFPYYKINASIISIQSLMKLNKLKIAENLLEKTYILILNNHFEKSDVMSNILYLKGSLNEEKGNLEIANKYYLKAEKIYRILKNNQGSSNIYITLGENEKKLRKYNSALLYFKKALEYSLNDKVYKLRALDNIGTIYLENNNYIKALELYQTCFNLSDLKINPNPKKLVGNFDNEIYLALLEHKAETWLAYYHHTHKKEYLQNALETFTVADKMVDYMRQEHVGYQSKLYWRDKTHSLYENAIEVCYLLKNYEMQSKNIAVNKKNKRLFMAGETNSILDEKAFYFFEKSRAVLLNDKINNLSANQLLSDTDQLKERQFQQQIAEMNAKLEQEKDENEKSALNIKLLDVQEKQQIFVKNVAVKYPSYYALKYDTSRYSLNQMLQYIKHSNTSFIEYFKGDSANYQLVISSNNLNLIKQKLTENPFQYLMNTSKLGKRVIVSQDGDFIPLDTLKDNKGELLLNKYAFSNTYSAQYLLRNAEKKPTKTIFNNFIGFAPVNYSKSMALPSLLGAENALDMVSQNYFWPKIYKNESASLANFIKSASNYKIIQLFTHADADNINKEPTIFFADSAMKVSELEAFKKFDAQLLVLSACKTNVGKVAKGEGTLSMAREFAAFGIPATITTLWSVENKATYQITELFYKYLKNGEPKDVALQKAKLEYLSINSKEKQNPIYWGAFVLMGETEPITLLGNKVYLYGIAILLLISLLIYTYKKYKILNISKLNIQSKTK